MTPTGQTNYQSQSNGYNDCLFVLMESLLSHDNFNFSQHQFAEMRAMSLSILWKSFPGTFNYWPRKSESKDKRVLTAQVANQIDYRRGSECMCRKEEHLII